MAGIDNNTLLYLRGDSFNDLSNSNIVFTNNGAIIEDDYIKTNGRHLYFQQDSRILNKNSDFTIEFYARIPNPSYSSSPGWETFFEINYSNASSTYKNDFRLGRMSNTDQLAIIPVERPITVSTMPIDGKWHHYAIVKYGSEMDFYIDGVFTFNISQDFNFLGNALFIGCNAYPDSTIETHFKSFKISHSVDYTEDFTPPTRPYNSININVTNKDFTKADFNISKLGQETINKVEIIQNNEVKETFTDSYDNLTFNHKGKAFKIVVTYDDNYTEEQEIHIGNSKAKIYLYKEGNECESLTGGFLAHVVDGRPIGTLTKNTDSFIMSCGSKQYINVTTKNIFSDFSIYSKLCSVYSSTASINNSCIGLAPLGTLGTWGEAYIKRFYEAGTFKTVVFDIPANTSDRYIGFAIAENNVISFSQLYLESKENVISINSQNTSSINFSCSNLNNLITITKAEVYINNKLSKAYNDNFDNITYDIDKNLCSIGVNNIKIKVTYSQGDDIYETVEELLTHTNIVNNLPTSSSLKELIDRQELLTNSIEVQKNNLKSILESKNVVVSEEENKLSILIQKVGELGEIILPLYLYKDGDECVNLTGGWVLNTVSTSSYGKIQLEKNETYMRLITPSGNTSGTTSRGLVITSNYINVTNYNKLKLEVLANINGTQAHNRLTFEVKNSSNTTLTKKEYNSYTNERTTEILDLSTITGNVTVQVYLDADGTSSNPKHYIEIYKIWLEE